MSQCLHRPDESGPDESGMVLVVVLWMIATIALAVSAMNASVTNALGLVGNERASAHLEAALEGAVEFAALQLLQRKSEQRWIADGRPYAKTIAGTQVMIRMFDESGRIDLNRSPPQLLQTFLRNNTGNARQAGIIADAIMAARTPAPERNVASEGIDPAAHENDSPDAFQHLTQLLQLPGMTMPVFRRLARHLTVYNHAGLINPGAATRDVLLAIPGISASRVELLLSGRAKDDSERRRAAIAEFSRGTSMITNGRRGAVITITAQVAAEKHNSDRGDTFNAPRITATILTSSQQGKPFRLLSWETTVR